MSSYFRGIVIFYSIRLTKQAREYRLEKMEKTYIYKAIISSPVGLLLVAADTTPEDAKYDLLTVASSWLSNASIRLFTMKSEPKRSTRQLLKSMNPVKATKKYDAKYDREWYWGYIARVKIGGENALL
jgi:hypothetical protein